MNTNNYSEQELMQMLFEKIGEEKSPANTAGKLKEARLEDLKSNRTELTSIPHVTTLEELKSVSAGSLVELPAFGENQPFVARLQRPSIMLLAKEGKIPNTLLKTANKLFSGEEDGSEDNSIDTLVNMLDVMEIVAEASLIEPSYKSIKEAGIRLTDEQLLAIFSYSQGGVEALKPFRAK